MKVLYTAIGCLLLMSCKKDGGSKPIVTITSPAHQQTFAPGQMVNISAKLEDDGDLHSIMLMVTNRNGGTNVMHFEEHKDVKTYDLNQAFTAQPGGVYLIEVSGEDHGGNKTTTSVQVVTQ